MQTGLLAAAKWSEWAPTWRPAARLSVL